MASLLGRLGVLGQRVSQSFKGKPLVGGLVGQAIKTVAPNVNPRLIQGFTPPQVQIPQVRLPQIQLPQLQMPQIRLPQIQLPRLQTPQTPQPFIGGLLQQALLKLPPQAPLRALGENKPQEFLPRVKQQVSELGQKLQTPKGAEEFALSFTPEEFALSFTPGGFSKITPKIIGKLPKVVKITEGALKERGFIRTVKKTVTPQIAENIEGFYTPYSDKAALDTANKILQQGGWDSAKKLVLEGVHDKTNVALGEILAKKALKGNRIDEFKEIIEGLSIKGTTGGQASQAFSMWSRMTPEGMLRYGTQEIRKAQQATGKLDIALGRVAKDLSNDEIKLVKDYMTKANASQTVQDQQKYAKLALGIINDKIPYGINKMFDTFRLNNILSNPRSHMRNIWGNLLNTYIVRPTILTFEGRPAQAIRYELGALKALPSAIDEAVKAFKGDLTELGKLDIEGLKQKKLPFLTSASLRTLSAEDAFFSKIIQSVEMSRGQTLDAAKKTSDYLLYRTKIGDKEAQAYLLQLLDKSVGRMLDVASKTPIINWFVPFARTPFNISKMQLEFSPLGIATLPGAPDKRTQLAKTMIGSLATLFGAKKALEGDVTFAPPTDTDAKELFYATGRRPFSIRFGDKWVPVAYFGPLGLAFMLPAMYKWYAEEAPTALTSGDIEKMGQVASSILYYWSQQTPLAGMGSFINLARGNADLNVLKNLGFTISQTIPYTGFLNYVSQVLDPIYRKPKGFAEQILSGIPGLSQTIEGTYTQPTGEPAVRSPSAFFAPYTLGTPTPEYEQLYQSRLDKLQENKIINEAKKEVSEEAESKMVSAGDKRFFVYTDIEGKPHSIPLDRPIPPINLTGFAELDKLAIGDFNAAINAKIKDIKILAQHNQLTLPEAETQIKQLQAQKTSAKPQLGKGGIKIKKPPKIKLGKTKIPKLTLPKLKTGKVKIPKFKGLTIPKSKNKSLKTKLPKLPKIKTRYNPKVRLGAFI